ncbi:ParB/RepB/Spo0J family partition protein [Nocardia transvalensis]|uniref:ParB/RepB/Spo0J family partition protein n=1 Tax=Nocardia transvalensis TaxID=37333 RepID=UPI0018941BC4|nr:ParB/RepB/Spo0J family partition protein [Nocardia transvalensis]MBF6328438.1 ParB/RepB/Spo0J family partition protein [Nocardia transvalensis]
MTSTTNTTQTDTNPADDAARSDISQVQAVFLNPADLEIDGNVRQNFNLDDHPAERESIETYGVKNPIKAVREADGQITVVDGQIRTLIALLVGLDRVPVWIEPAPDTSAKQRKIARITEQINLNDRRIPLTRGDRARGIAQLLQLGLSVTRVAKAVQENDLDKVRQAGRAGASATACRLVDDNQLDFDQAAILADYDSHGDTEAVERLLKVPRHCFAYEANLIARERDDTRAQFQASLPYAALGFAILTAEPDSIGANSALVPVEALRTGDDAAITPEQLYADAARWMVYLEVEEDAVVDRVTGEAVDPNAVDWRTESNPDLDATDGRRHADTVERRDVWTPHYFLPAAALDASGYKIAAEPDPEPEQPVDDTATVVEEPANAGTIDEPAPAEDPEAARVAAERARAERQAREDAARQAREEAEREAKRLSDLRKELNKQFAAATAARRSFVQTYLERGSVPPLAIRFILEALAANRGLLDDYEATKLALQLLGIEGWRDQLDQAIEKARPGRCAVILLGLVCGACESRIAKEAWIHNDRGTRHYLHFLADIGHHLVPTEQAAAGDIDPMTITTDA